MLVGSRLWGWFAIFTLSKLLLADACEAPTATPLQQLMIVNIEAFRKLALLLRLDTILSQRLASAVSKYSCEVILVYISMGDRKPYFIGESSWISFRYNRAAPRGNKIDDSCRRRSRSLWIYVVVVWFANIVWYEYVTRVLASETRTKSLRGLKFEKYIWKFNYCWKMTIYRW